MSTKADYHAVYMHIPEWLWGALGAEAIEQDRSATKQLIQILKERYREEPVVLADVVAVNSGRKRTRAAK